MPARGLLIALTFLVVSPQAQPRLPVHVESLEYPPLARQARITGDVILHVYVDSDGRITALPSVLTGHPILAEAAEKNLKSWRFQPGASAEVTVKYHFELDGEPNDHAPSKCSFDLPDSVTIVAPPPTVQTLYSKPKSN